jgi:NADPH-dependent 2,4-dienoyl-CoA reductase/sulfur reductase-like enzyme
MHAPAEKSDFVIIGGVAAGPKTAATLARRLPGSTITLFQKEKQLSYAACGFPFFASGEVSSFAQLFSTSYGIPRDPDFFISTKGFNAVTSAEVIGIDREKKTVAVKMLETGLPCRYPTANASSRSPDRQMWWDLESSPSAVRSRMP